MNTTNFGALSPQSLSVATILVVDDDPETRVLLNSVLGDHLGYMLVFAKDGEAAIEVFRRTDPDLVITDLSMPRLDGFRLIGHLKEAYPAASIIALSGGSKRLLKRAETLGAEVALAKPIHPDDLVAAVEQALAGPVPAPQAPSRLCRSPGKLWLPQLFESEMEADGQVAGRWHSAKEAASITFDQALSILEESGAKAEYLHYCITARVDPASATIDSAMVSTIARWMAPFLAVGALTRPKLKKAIASARTEMENARIGAATAQ